MFKPQEVIRKKRDRLSLSDQELENFFLGYLKDEVAEYQMSAMLMAIWLNGMSREETVKMTRLSLESGEQFKWNFPAPIVGDKHSTGGVGDKTSLVILPLAILEGLKIPMMSGRGLGHTGGTLDKLESIPGMNVFPDVEAVKSQIQLLGGVFLGQTPKITALDKKLYALRDVTATVESIPLITASILSKKLAEGLDHLVLDIKFGSGAFLQSIDRARELAESLVSVGKECGLGVRALLTSMNSPLGTNAGNNLEVIECIQVMQGAGPSDTRELSLELTAELVEQCFPDRDPVEIRESLALNLGNGRAFDCFCKIISRQGGDISYLENTERFPKAKIIKPLLAKKKGQIHQIDVRKLGIAILGLGGGRLKVTDKIDPSVGLTELGRVGKTVDQSEPLAVIHAQSEAAWVEAAELVEQAIVLGSGPVPKEDRLILERMT